MANDNCSNDITNTSVPTYLRPDMLAELDECVDYYQSSRAAVLRMALIEFLAAWRGRVAPSASGRGDVAAAV